MEPILPGHCCACYVLGGFRCHVDHEIRWCDRHQQERRIVPETLFQDLARTRADGGFTARLRVRVKDDRELLRRLSRSGG